MGSKSFWIVVLMLWMAEIFVLSQIPGTDQRFPDIIYFIERKAAHVTEFFILAFLIYKVLGFYRLTLGGKLGLIFFLALFWAAIDEIHQTFVFGRDGNFLDVGIDSIGIFMFLGLILVLRISKSSFQ